MMICEGCLGNKFHTRFGRRGYRFDIGHWYQVDCGNMAGDSEYVCAIGPWLKAVVWIRDSNSPYGGGRRGCAWLSTNNTCVRGYRREYPEVIELAFLKHEALSLAVTAMEEAAHITKAILADFPAEARTVKEEPKAVTNLRRRIEKAQAVLQKIRSKYRDGESDAR